MGSLSSEGLVILREKYQLTCERPNTERRCQHAVEGGVPATGVRTDPEGKPGQGAEGDCSMPGSLLAPKRSWEPPFTKHLLIYPSQYLMGKALS